MAMRQTDLDEVPPPPYSETDIYSNPSSNSPHVPSHHGDDVASRGSSHASSHSEVIFTPPLTPRTSGSGAPLHHDSNASLNLSNHSQAASQAPSSAYSDFAATYFESRPAPALSPRDQIVHGLTVTPTSTPDDIPYPPTWAARDITQQDWATFTNCLIPHHAAARNEAVISRKLQAEEDAIATAAAESTGSSNKSSSHASAQLDQIRSDPDTDPAAAAATAAAAAVSGRRREDADAVIAQWNDGFFRPRGVVLRLNPDVEDLRMPGAWDRSFDRNPESRAVAEGGSGGPTPVPFPVRAHAPGPAPAAQPQTGSQESRSWSFGGITVTTEGISIGDRIVADGNGIRVGNLIADENGIRFGSNTTPRSQPHYVGPNWAPPPPHPAPNPGPGPIYGPGHFPQAPHSQPAPHPGPHEHPFFQGAHGGGARGRRTSRRPSDQRSLSASSSASSSSSTSSASSVGSLPDYEELYPSQLPIYKQRITAWLSHPDQPVTKADITQLREEIRSAHAAATEQRNSGNPGAAAATARTAEEEKALKTALKALTQEWRKLKRQQRAVRKEKRRERRARRKEERRERREQRRESKREKRGTRREQREIRRGAGGSSGDQHHGSGPTPSPWGVPFPFMPPPGVHVPPPPVMHAHPQPSVPVPNSIHWGPGPGRGFGQGGFPAAWGRGLGRGWGRGFGAARGFNRGSEPFNSGLPGAWPTEGDGTPDAATTQAAPSSQDLFRAVEEMERDIALKVEELDRVRNEIRDSNPGRGRCGGSRGRGRDGCSRGERSDPTAQRLEEEIDALSQNVEKLKVEADAEFARELAAEDRKTGGEW
ncbi:hypothetical protein EsH8_V_000249 [Colletotrichum jinshuiense]